MTASTIGASPPTRRRRRLPWRLLAVLVLVAVGVPALAWAYTSWRTAVEVAAALAETDQLDPRWRLADVLADRPALADAENSALQTAKVMKVLDAPAVQVSDAVYECARGLGPTVALTPDLHASLREALEKHPEALIEARKLRTLPHGRPQTKYAADFISTRITAIRNAREVCTLLHCDVFVNADEDEFDAALQSAHAMLNAARSLGDEVFAMAFLVRLSCLNLTIDAVERVLAQGVASGDRLAEVQEAFQAELAESALLNALRGERGGLDQAIQLLDEGKLSPALTAVLTGMPRPPGAGRWLQDRMPSRMRVDRAAFLRRMNALVELARLPVERQAREIDRVAKQLEESPAPFLRLQRSLRSALPANLRLHANLRCTVAALAAERYRLKHGVWPKSLDALVEAGLLPAVPRDPYDGEPLRTQYAGGNLVIYSIGRDHIDNGGTIQRYLENVIGRFEPPEGTDLGVRLWEPSRRGRLAE
jgi:hypothetical protein